MNLINSQQRQLNFGEILHLYHENTYSKDAPTGDFKTWLAGMATAMQKLKPKQLVIGNTVFLYKPGTGAKKHAAMIWALNADSPDMMVKNAIELLQKLLAHGITEVVAAYTSPAISRVLRQAFAQVKTAEDEMSFKTTADGKTVMTAKFKGRRDV